VIISGLAVVALCVAIGWLAKVVLTGRATRPGWRMICGAPLVYVLLLASFFGRP